MNEVINKGVTEVAANLDPYWMPLSHNRYFKQHPAHRLLARAEGAYYWRTRRTRPKTSDPASASHMPSRAPA